MAVTRPRGEQLNITSVAQELSGTPSAITILAQGVASDPGATQALSESFLPIARGGTLLGGLDICFEDPYIWWKHPLFPCDNGGLWCSVVKNGCLSFTMNTSSIPLASPFSTSNSFILQGGPHPRFQPGFRFVVWGTSGFNPGSSAGVNDGLYEVVSANFIGPDTEVFVTKTIPGPASPGFVGDFQTEIVAMQLCSTGVTIPTGVPLQVNGGLTVQSFFDVFTNVDMQNNHIVNVFRIDNTPAVPIEIVALELKSIAPISVTPNNNIQDLTFFNQGAATNQSRLRADSTVQKISIQDSNNSGGTFTSRFEVTPLFTFVRNQLELPVGTGSNPTLLFTSDPDTGLFHPGADQVGVTIGGVEKVRFDSTGVTVFSGFFAPGTGGAGAPEFSFSNDTNTGLFRSGVDTINISTGGTSRMSISTVSADLSIPLAMGGNKIAGLANGLAGGEALHFGQIGTQVQAWNADLDGLVALASTGLVVRTGGSAFAERTIIGTASRLTVTDGDGVGGNPTLDISASYIGQASITTLGTITTGVWDGTDVAVTAGGTGASTASGARTNLGLVIGTDVQAWDTDLDAIAGLTPVEGQFIVRGTSAWVHSGRCRVYDGTVTTTDATSTVVRSIAVSVDQVLTFTARGHGHQPATGDTYSTVFHGTIENDGGTTTIIGTNTGAHTAFDAGATTWTITAVANDTTDVLEVTVMGEAAKTINWHVCVEVTVGG